MNHEEWQVLVSAYHDGEVTAEERALVEAHLAECAECTELLADCQRFGQTLHDLPRGEPSRELWQRVQEKLPTRRPALWRRLLPALSAVTVLAVALTVVASLRLGGLGMAPSAIQSKEVAEVQVVAAPTMEVLASPMALAVPAAAPSDTLRIEAAGANDGAPAPCPGVPLAMEVVSLAVARDAALSAPQVRGTLYDAAGRPVVGATLVVSGTAGWQGSAITAGDGTFALDLPAAGSYRLVLGLGAGEGRAARDEDAVAGYTLPSGAVCSVPLGTEEMMAPVILAEGEVAMITLRLR